MSIFLKYQGPHHPKHIQYLESVFDLEYSHLKSIVVFTDSF